MCARVGGRDAAAFYNEQAVVVIQFCNERGIAYRIKNGATALK
jgi:hypothetical protein